MRLPMCRKYRKIKTYSDVDYVRDVYIHTYRGKKNVMIEVDYCVRGAGVDKSAANSIGILYWKSV